MSNLAALNNLRAEAKALGMTGYGRMKKADLEAAVNAEQTKQDVERSIRNEQEIDRLRVEHKTASPERQKEITYALARLGAVLYPQGTQEHEQYRTNLRAALADPKAWDFLEAEHKTAFEAGEPIEKADPEIAFAEAVDAQDVEAMKAIIEQAAPVVVDRPLRDPNATRYEDLPMWTDERLEIKEEELVRRLARRTLLGHDRKLSESRLARVKAEIESRTV